MGHMGLPLDSIIDAIGVEPYFRDDAVVIYHADCHDILPKLPEVDLVLTDPPYGMNYQHGARKGGVRLGMDEEHVIGDDGRFDPRPLLSFPRVILWGANHYSDTLAASRGWLVWDKRCGIPSNDQSDCEMAWTSWMTTARLYSRYWNGGGINEERYHPTQKPIALMKWCLELVPDTQTILDPFMGSGTTLRAAKDLGRYAIGIEIEERYCDIAAKRMAQTVMAL